MISIDDLTVTVGDTPILDHVSTRVGSGEIVYLLGRNGAGKTTLLRALCGVVRPSTGSVLIDAPSERPAPLTSLSRPALRLGVHLGGDAAGTASGPNPGHTGRRHLRWLATAGGIDPARVDTVLHLVGLRDVADRRLGGYSLGMRQRLGIASALLPDAPNLIFDEPLNGLDIDGIRWMRALLKKLAAEGRSLLIASHMLDEVARTADRVVVLERGAKVADATVDDFVGTHADLEEAYVALTRPGATAKAGPSKTGTAKAGTVKTNTAEEVR